MGTKKEAVQKKIEAATADIAKAIRLEPGDEFLTTHEAAALTKMSSAYYEKARWQKKGPPYLQRGRSVRYLKSQLLEWWGKDQDQRADSSDNRK